MDTTSGTVTVWQSGRLAPHATRRPFELTREHALVSGLLVLSAIVLSMFIGVLEKDMARGELQHVAQRSRAVAEAQCEADQPAQMRGRCIAMLNGDDVALEAAPTQAPDDSAYDTAVAQESAARATTMSLLAAR